MKKKVYLILLQCILLAPAFAQTGHIDSFAVIPAHPAHTDAVKILAYCTFSSTGCNLQSSTVDQSTLNATAGHCIGMLTAICHQTDTFTLAPRPAGNYTFRLTLITTTLPTCSAALSQHDSVAFTVIGPASGIGSVGTTAFSSWYRKGQLWIKSLPSGIEDYEIRVMDLTGRMIFSRTQCRAGATVRVDLAPGLYVVCVLHKHQRLINKVVVE